VSVVNEMLCKLRLSLSIFKVSEMFLESYCHSLQYIFLLEQMIYKNKRKLNKK